jgi:hypothetical protein
MKKLKNESNEWKRKNMPTESKPKVTNELSKRDLEELMGVHRPTYKRSKGAMRQK